jgi:hypothetical protein
MVTNNRLVHKFPDDSTETEPEGPRHLTSSQAAALRRLSNLASLQGVGEKAGILVRNKPLIIGPSGSGKSAIVCRLATLEGLPLLVINAGTWIVYGAYTNPHTVTVIRRFIRSHRRSILFIDEIDKIVGGEMAFSHGWSLSVLAECIGILDSDKKLAVCGWKTSDVEHLRKSCFVIGAGAWQLHAAKARRERNVAYADLVAENAGIPEEVLFRFNPGLIQILPPGEKDFRQSIRRIRAELSLPALSVAEETTLVTEAVESLRGMRWAEQYLADLLITNPREDEEVSEEESNLGEPKAQISRVEYQQRLDAGLKCMTELQRLVFELETKFRLAQQIVQQMSVDEKPPIPAEKYQTLVTALSEFAPCLLYATTPSNAERHRKETEMHVHGWEVLGLLDPWLKDRAFALHTHGVLETAISVRVLITRLLSVWRYLASVEVEE